jgi:hypothetical protein
MLRRLLTGKSSGPDELSARAVLIDAAFYVTLFVTDKME